MSLATHGLDYVSCHAISGLLGWIWWSHLILQSKEKIKFILH